MFEAEHQSSENNQHFVGLMVYDPVTKDTLLSKNAAKYFTPASNVKLATLYTGLQFLPERIPAVQYVVKNDTLFIKGTGDPTWLHPYFKDSTAIQFIKQYKNVAVCLQNFKDDRYGPGWAWEDYQYYFSPERGAMPLYGNVVEIKVTDSVEITPKALKPNLALKDTSIQRNYLNNSFYVSDIKKDTIQIPFITSDTLTLSFLKKEVPSNIFLTDYFPEGNQSNLFSIKTDSVYKRMLFESDNFLAEQLLLMVSSQISDHLSFETARDSILNANLSDLKQMPRWVDGSGLSRYNLFTPESFIQILEKLYQEIPEERLFQLMPAWNASGTLTEQELAESSSFIFAKSGSVGNNYNLSGYLKTKSGKIVLFSYMNNHFKIPSKTIRKKMETMLHAIHEAY